MPSPITRSSCRHRRNAVRSGNRLGRNAELPLRGQSARRLPRPWSFAARPPTKIPSLRIKGSVFGFYAANDPSVDATVPPAQAAAKAAGVVFEAVTYDGVGPGFLQSGDAPDAKPADKLARGYALERMKSVLDMVSLRGY